MGDTDPLAGCEEKLKRADFHFDSLKSLIGTFFEAKPDSYWVIPEVDVESSRCLGRIRITREPPLNWSVVVGDYVQNLRAVLEHLIWQLVIANGEKPSSGNAFPLFDQEPPQDPCNGERKRWERNVWGVSAEALRFIEFCQPYKALHGPTGHTLSALRLLSNEDKHRTLVPALAAIHRDPDLVSIDLVEFRDIRPPTERVTIHAGRPLKDRSVVFQTPVIITGPNPEVEAKTNLPLDIGFGRKPVPLEGLKQMSEAVAMILRESRRFFGA